MQPTNPEVDFEPTGKCEVWIREVNLIAQAELARTEAHCIDPESPTSPAKHVILSQVSDATRACHNGICNPHGKCVGMLSIELF